MERKICVLYGSQTGTAQEVAERVARDARRYRFEVKICSMNDYEIENLSTDHLSMFVCSTTGQGETPDNMKNFWKFLLQKKLPDHLLQNLTFSVIGLGDSSYSKFNFVAKRLNRRLQQLGGTCFLPVALADDQHDLGLDGALNPWLSSFWENIASKYPLPNGLEMISDKVLPPSKFRYFKVLKESDPKEKLSELSCGNFMAKVISCERVTHSDHFQDVRLIKLDIRGSELHYKPGDVAIIQPNNLNKTVEEFLDVFPHWNADEYFILEENESNIPVPEYFKSPISLRKCMSDYLDIKSVPRRYFFELLKFFTESDLEKEKFEEFCSSEGQDELFSYCNRPRRTIIETLADFPHTPQYIDKSYLFDLIPVIQPRSFSIASSELANPGELHILVAVVKYKTILQEPRTGLCSTWLASLNEGDNVPLKVRCNNSFTFPEGSEPVIMVGPGTGVAPFRSFIQQRVCNKIGGNYLFFGCRNKNKDFFCAEEWKKYVEQNYLKIFTAFSRDQETKIYVQHIMANQSSLLFDLLMNKGAYFYIAGNSKRMPDDVLDSLKTIIQEEGNLDYSEASSFINFLANNKRLQMETWS